MSNQLAWISILGKKNELSSKFGGRKAPIKGASTYHNGLDIRADMGTPIYAPEDGVFSGGGDVNSKKGGGLQMFVKGSSGHRFGFAHLSKLNKKNGDKVSAGDLIGYSGNSGGSTGPHVHFTVTNPKGAKINPINFSMARIQNYGQGGDQNNRQPEQSYQRPPLLTMADIQGQQPAFERAPLLTMADIQGENVPAFERSPLLSASDIEGYEQSSFERSPLLSLSDIEGYEPDAIEQPEIQAFERPPLLSLADIQGNGEPDSFMQETEPMGL